MGLQGENESWTDRAEAVDTAEQDRLGQNETPTDSVTFLNASLAFLPFDEERDLTFRLYRRNVRSRARRRAGGRQPLGRLASPARGRDLLRRLPIRASRSSTASPPARSPTTPAVPAPALAPPYRSEFKVTLSPANAAGPGVL